MPVRIPRKANTPGHALDGWPLPAD